MHRTKAIAEWVANSKFDDFPTSTVEHTKKLMLKTITGMVYGSREPISRLLTNYYADRGSAPQAGVVCSGYRTTVEDAAFANGTFAHSSELEDNELPSITSAYWMFPALFPLAEHKISSGRDILQAAIIMWEVSSRFNRAAPGWILMSKHMCPPSYFGPIGVAAGASKLLGASAREIEHAMTMAGSWAGGLSQSGSDTHFLESGHTCQMGVKSAFLARAGATAEIGVLEKPKSLWAPVWADGQVNLEILTEGLGQAPYLIDQACIKKYSACTYSHTSIDALGLIMQEEGLSNDDIDTVLTEVSQIGRIAVGSKPKPRDLLEARFSLEYLLAEVLRRGKVDVETFERTERLTEDEHLRAASKVSVGDLTELEPAAQGAQVTVVAKNGKKFVKRLDEWIGSPSSPLSHQQIEELCRPYLEMMLPTEACDRIENIVRHFEHLPDLLELTDILTHRRVGHRG